MMTEVGNRSSQLTAASPPTMWSPKWSTPWLPSGVLNYNSDSDSHRFVGPWSEKSKPLPRGLPRLRAPRPLALPCSALLPLPPSALCCSSLPSTPTYSPTVPGTEPSIHSWAGHCGAGHCGAGLEPREAARGPHTQKVLRNLSLGVGGPQVCCLCVSAESPALTQRKWWEVRAPCVQKGRRLLPSPAPSPARLVWFQLPGAGPCASRSP